MKTNKYIKLGFILLIMSCISVSAKETVKDKSGILLVTFGTSYANAQQAYDRIEAKVKGAFPDTEIRWAYTANFIRKKLHKQGKHVDSPAEALAKMASDGYTHIAVQSLHIIPGEEYNALKQTVTAFNHMPKNAKVVLIGEPLLYTHEDMMATLDAMSSVLPEKIGKSEAVVLMGHGTSHQSNVYYPGFQYYLWQKSPSIFLGTVEGYPELGDIIEKLKDQKIKKVYLQPFMSVAGDHAQNDMAGDDADSWKSQLEAQGFEVKTVLKGLAEYDAIVDVWIKHLKETFGKL
ncbi:sirohydrochlorin cobaltochelatase [Mangrovibacterium marinum]|uniref:Sirohydrochlorin cobaltochelatase n=1 Tax=Mangrovibacterium marinum TaxID=1639118 RepID=A0A2T5C2Y0_9BACT|nr:sirohydrochlorin cobaltochelatase [Mangrovibacterium marinum]PTN09103.1 sirohydrochlorin cobaltochelatase [Mangrovibacterium marinum]